MQCLSISVEAASTNVTEEDLTARKFGTTLLYLSGGVDTTDLNGTVSTTRGTASYLGSCSLGLVLPKKGVYYTGVVNLTVKHTPSAGSLPCSMQFLEADTGYSDGSYSVYVYGITSTTTNFQIRFYNYYAAENTCYINVKYQGRATQTSSIYMPETMSYTLTTTFSGVSLSYDTGSMGEKSNIEYKEGEYVQQDDGSYSYEESSHSETKDQGGVFSTIINAITSIPKKIVEGFKALFIPSNDYFSDWFDDLNTFFTEHLGFLWQPIEWTISVINAFLGSGGSTTLTFPGFSIMGQQVWPDIEFDLNTIWGQLPVQDYIYMATDLIIIGAIINLVYRKYQEVMTG